MIEIVKNKASFKQYKAFLDALKVCCSQKAELKFWNYRQVLAKLKYWNYRQVLAKLKG